jgi:hypothetical protein
MMLARADLKRLRMPLVVALLLAGVGVGALLFAEQKGAEAQLSKKAGEERLAAASIRLAKVAEEEQEISNNLVQFRRFAEKGMTSGEKRLEWIEALAAIRQQRRLFEVHYNLERQRPVDFPGIKSTEPIFMATKLKLEMLLLHEEDLLRVLGDLNTSSQFFSSLRNCTITRAEAASAVAGPIRPRLRADCAVDIITLKAPDKPS